MGERNHQAALVVQGQGGLCFSVSGGFSVTMYGGKDLVSLLGYSSRCNGQMQKRDTQSLRESPLRVLSRRNRKQLNRKSERRRYRRFFRERQDDYGFD